MPVQETFILPWLLWSAQYKIWFFLTVHYFNFCVPIAQQPGQAVVLARLSLNVCLRSLKRVATGLVWLILCKIHSYHTESPGGGGEGAIEHVYEITGEIFRPVGVSITSLTTPPPQKPYT